MKNTKIPRATAKRLPVYYRYLTYLLGSGVDRINSTELSEAIKVDAATIRRDFSYFGALGKRGYGYDVKSLLKFFGDVLDQDQITKVALVGAGNLGQALLGFNFHHSSNLQIVAAFDADPKAVKQPQSDVPVYAMSELKKKIKAQDVKIAILAVPQHVAQEVTDELLQAGIKGILNFTPLRVSVPKGVRVQNVDLTNELQTLVYFVDNYGKIMSED